MPTYKPKGLRPTLDSYNALEVAYDFFNGQLFEGSLPRCCITLQRKANSRGFFAPQRFGNLNSADTVHEIALNPSHFRERTPAEILSTLVHEMCHLQQEEQQPGSTRNYHDAEWGAMMRAVGLEPSATGEAGGRTTGQKMTHYVRKPGPFDSACKRLVTELRWQLAYVELWGDPVVAKAKAKSKTKYTCSACNVNAWAKPATLLICGACYELAGDTTPMQAEPNEEEPASVAGELLAA